MRYLSALGNAWPVPVAQWLGRRICQVQELLQPAAAFTDTGSRHSPQPELLQSHTFPSAEATNQVTTP